MTRLPAPEGVHADNASLDGAVPVTGEQRRAAEASSLLALVATIVSETALATALLYYFGWVRAQTSCGYFGVSPGLAGLSTPNYVLRSINVTFLPLIHTAIAGVLLLGLHRVVVLPVLDWAGSDSPRSPGASGSGTDPGRRHRAPRVFLRVVGYARMLGNDRRRVIRWFVITAEAVAGALALVVVIGVLLPTQVGVPLGLILPLLLLASVTVIGYLGHLRSRYPEQLARTRRAPRSTPASRAQALGLRSLGLLASLWAVSLYGDQVGTRIATDFAAGLPDQSEVVVYSTARIALSGPGVAVAEITQPGTKYHFQYTGLRLLAHSADKYLLLPRGWQHGRDRVFLVRDDDSVRIDIAAR